MRRASKVDDNQSAIVEALIKIGCSVQSLAAVGDGVPDLLVGYRGLNILLECKDGDKSPSRRKLTPAQIVWHEGWLGQVATIISPEDAVAYVIGIERKV